MFEELVTGRSGSYTTLLLSSSRYIISHASLNDSLSMADKPLCCLLGSVCGDRLLLSIIAGRYSDCGVLPRDAGEGEF